MQMASGITRWQPFPDIAELRSRLDRAFADLSDSRRGEWMPAIDVTREEGMLRIRANVPGVRPDQIPIEIAEDTLTIPGHHAEEHETREAQYVRRERSFGSFTRS